MIRRALDWIWAADAFEGDWWGFMLNQIGHIGIGLVLAWLGLPLWGLLLLYVLVIETPQLIRDGPAWDGVQDTAFVAAGATMLLIPDPSTAVVPALMLLSGILRRADA